MPESLPELLAKIQGNLRNQAYPNERSIVSRVVLPILDALGWDKHDPRQVIEEFSPLPTQPAKKVDLALCARAPQTKADAYLEAKSHGALRDPATLQRAEDQLSEYESYYRVALAILTDGQRWRFYYPLADGTYADRLAIEIDLLNDSQEVAAARLNDFLSFSNTHSGRVSRSR